jgi:hypothetical protein
MQRTRYIGLVICAALLATLSANAESVYQQPTDFIAAVFNDNPPNSEVLWITKDVRADINRLLGRELKSLRIRYWKKGTRSAWVLDEIGKDLPITTGVVIDSGAIKDIQVLVFRESRGWEVRYPFFTDQFSGATLDKKYRLDKRVDSISGATMSVNALKRQARLALLLVTYTD